MHRIERAQQYYDKREVWNQAARDYASQHDEVTRANANFKEATAELSALEREVASISSSKTCQGNGTICFAADGWATPHATGEASPESIDAVSDDPSFSRMIRLAALVDRVTTLQAYRDEALRMLEIRSRQVEEARERFDREAEQHSRCNCNCSIVIAAPLFERRQARESAISAQMAKLSYLQQRLREARERQRPQESEAALSRSTSFYSAYGGEISPCCFQLPFNPEGCADPARGSESNDELESLDSAS